ncbi:type II toxin-antitoxin system RelE/ParE family toxin [Pseudomonas silvicola]|nr:type II toxin-antitoxin system RelE/ParE family toxin [Pseudomonas silvicola]
MATRKITFVGNSKNELRSFPPEALRAAGYQLDRVQRGDLPLDWKPISTVGPGVHEIRITADDGAFRVFYLVNRPEAVYVLHAFNKTTQKTPKRAMEMARRRLKSLG